MQALPYRNTAYRLYVTRKLQEWCDSGRSNFTVYEFAEFAGLKVTTNLRRQVNSFVHAGDLAIAQQSVQPHRNGNVYWFTCLLQEMPF